MGVVFIQGSSRASTTIRANSPGVSPRSSSVRRNRVAA
jgi:hypothetical protein